MPNKAFFTSQTLESDNIQDIFEKFPGLNAIGYREILPYLAGEQSLERTTELVQQNSRHYAKRQLTWFRRYTTHTIEGFFGA